MASSRKRPSDRRVTVALSGGIDSVVLLHQLKSSGPVDAIHVHHGLSPNADAWAAFCRRLCRHWRVPLKVFKVRVIKSGQGLEAAARKARYDAFAKSDADCIALAHNLDDQAETVLMNLLRGAGRRGASGMASESTFKGRRLVRPLLGMTRREIEAYARRHKLEWVEDESNADVALTRNFIRHRVGSLLEERFPGWKRSLARAARHFAREEAGAEAMLRKFLQRQGLRAPSEAKLVEMLKQLTSDGARTALEHDGARLRVYRGTVRVEEVASRPAFTELKWRGESRLALPALGGELRFRRTRGKGIDARRQPLEVRVRSGGERLQPDERRPRRTLKNLFQEAGVPPWERDRLPLLACGDDLVWVPGLGVDIRYRAAKNAPGVLPEWRKMAS